MNTTLDKTLAALVALAIIAAVALQIADKDATQGWIIVGLLVGAVTGKQISKDA